MKKNILIIILGLTALTAVMTYQLRIIVQYAHNTFETIPE